MSFRFDVREEDVESVKVLVEASGVFSEEEISVAGELVEENLAKGAEESGYHFIFLEEIGGLMGYACFGRIPLTQACFDLYWIAVAPRHQGKGCSVRIMDKVFSVVSGMGGKYVYAETSGTPFYEPARRFYLKNGFEEIACFPDFYKDGDAKVVYRKRLPVYTHL